MNLLKSIQTEIQSRNMLQHPFYQDWMSGKLTQKQLQNYAAQYLPFVEAFPRFVSATHSHCESAESRKLLLENLMDEEGLTHSEPHPKLWQDFAKGIGSNLDSANPIQPQAENLKNTFLNLSQSSYVEGLCSLYAYESQIPAIAQAKIEGLKLHYQITDAQTTQFFAIHETADVYHSQACAGLIEKIADDDFDKAIAATKKSTTALWDFLTEVHQS